MYLTNCSSRTYLQSFVYCLNSLWTVVSTLLLCVKFLPRRYFLGPKKYKLLVLSPECEECTKTCAQRIRCFEVHWLLMCLPSLYFNALKLPRRVSFQHIMSVAYHVFRKEFWYGVFGARLGSLFSYHTHPLQSRNQLWRMLRPGWEHPWASMLSSHMCVRVWPDHCFSNFYSGISWNYLGCHCLHCLDIYILIPSANSHSQ
jgi:hypothetical protein